MCRTPGDVFIARCSAIAPRAAGARPHVQNAGKMIIQQTTVQTLFTVSTAVDHTLLIPAHVKNGMKKEIITLKVKEDISFPEARKRLSFLQKGSYALVTRAGGVSSRTSVGTQVCPKDLVAPPALPATQRSAPRQRLSLEPKSTGCPEAVPVPSSKKAVDTAAPKEVSPPKPAGVVHATPPSGPKEGSLPTTYTKEPERAPLASAGPPPGRGRASTTQASTASRKPGRLDEVHSSASQQSPAEEMMDESMPPLDDDLTISGAESSPVPSEAAEKLKKKKARIFPPKGL
ncbi:unnamed protein product [Ixodes hexagonus]